MKIHQWKMEENKMSISSSKNPGSAERNFWKNGLTCFAILAWALLFATNAHAVVQSSANFTMNSNVLDSGGGSSSKPACSTKVA